MSFWSKNKAVTQQTVDSLVQRIKTLEDKLALLEPQEIELFNTLMYTRERVAKLERKLNEKKGAMESRCMPELHDHIQVLEEEPTQRLILLWERYKDRKITNGKGWEFLVPDDNVSDENRRTALKGRGIKQGRLYHFYIQVYGNVSNPTTNRFCVVYYPDWHWYHGVASQAKVRQVCDRLAGVQEYLDGTFSSR